MNETNLAKTIQWSCYMLENAMTINNEHLRVCLDIKFKKRPKSEIIFSNYDATVDRFLDMRQFVIKALNIDDNVEFDICRGCPQLAKRPAPHGYKIRVLNIQDFYTCNLNCIYCVRGTKNHNKTDIRIADYRLLVETLKRRNLIDDNLHVNIASDEVSLIPGCDELMSIFKYFACCIFTNALIFRDSIKRSLQSNNRHYIITSVDAGTRETFTRIKGRYVWKIVHDNLIEYSNGGLNCVKLKYIILPGINDNYDDAEGFIKLCDDVRASTVILSRDNIYDAIPNENLPDNAIQILAYIWQKAQNAGIKVEILHSYFSEDELSRLNMAMVQLKTTVSDVES